MSWVKLDDRFPEHPKVLEAGEDAAWLFVAGLGYCNRNPSNRGFIPSAQVPRLTLKKNPMELARRLVACGEPIGKAGLWEEVQGGFLVHDYHEYQPEGAGTGPGAVVLTPEDRSKVKREAGRKGGQATQRRAPQVAQNLKQHRSNAEAGSTEAAPKQPEACSAEAGPKQDRSSEAPKQTEAHRSPVPVPVPESAHTGARDAQAGAREGAAQAPASAPPSPPPESLEQRWARVADVAGFSFPGIIELRREVEAGAEKLGQPFEQVFDAAVAAFKAWRETCDKLKRPPVSPMALVRNWAHVWQLLAPASSQSIDGGGSVVPSAAETRARFQAEQEARNRSGEPRGAAALELLRQQQAPDQKATA